MSKGQTPSFEDLLESLYGSILDPARAQEFGADLARAMNSRLVAVQVDDSHHRHRVRGRFPSGPDRNAPPSNAEGDDAAVNQFFLKGAERMHVHGVVNGADLFARGKLERTAYYRDGLVPHDVLHGIGTILHLDGNTRGISTPAINRDMGRPPFDERDEAFLKRLMPHLQNVYALQQRLQFASHMASALDRLATAAWVLDRDGRVLQANDPALRLLEEPRRCLRQQNQRLSPAWEADRIPFLQAIADANRASESRSIRRLLRDPAGLPEATCIFHPLLHGRFDGWMLTGQPVVLMMLAPLTPRGTASIELLRQSYGLTRAEAQLAQALLRHGSLAACRQALRKSSETLRTQLKALFAKTGTRRQSELLVKLQELAS